MPATGPLRGVMVLELAGLGPGPFAGMLLADLGADVVRIERPQRPGAGVYDRARQNAAAERYYLHRGRRSIALNLRSPAGVEVAMRLVERAGVLIEGYRPGVAEKMGLGPQEALTRNPRLVYGRMTGWGQDGPVADTAGHDLTYLAVTGALHGLAHADGWPITPPPIVGDMGGGGAFLALGIIAALYEVERTGEGQVVDAAVMDGVLSLTSIVRSMHAQGRWQDRPGVNFSDGASPSYGVYETSDGRHMAIAAMEEPFWLEFLRLLGPEADGLPSRDDPANWDELRRRLAGVFARRTQREWTDLFLHTDACVAPVLNLEEAAEHPQVKARQSLVPTPWGSQPAPAPRLQRTPAQVSSTPPQPGQHTAEILTELGFADVAQAQLRADGVVS